MKARKVKVRRVWGIRPATKIIPDKTKKPFRKRKHKARRPESY